MGKSKAELRAQESRWALPVALASLLSVGLLGASGFVTGVSGDGDAEVLRSVEENSGAVLLGSLMQALGFALLALPLLYLFRAARARSERVRSLLIGLVVAAPLFLALASGLNGAVQREAADEFVAGKAKPTLSQGEAKRECRDEDDPPADCAKTKLEDDAASEARTEASLAPLATGFGIGGALGIIAAFFYTCLWAMRTGLLSRFWGSLGMVLGIATVIGLIFFLWIWLIYLALMVVGKVPNGKPPAWEQGEAVPWPTPGERAAAELEPEDGWDEAEEAEEEGEPDSPRRKRKQRE
ncbi:MAG TPA: hypothetical protein VHH14_00440 [Solirubrobacterales bacterium]|nr:hypothetical protein [Solirubrobacterales bacterium]